MDHLRDKYQILMSLSDKHPSFISNYREFLAVLERHLPLLGSEANQMYSSLEAKPRVNAQERTMITMCNELQSLSKIDIVTLTKYPLAHYIYAREVATIFLNDVDSSTFYDATTVDIYQQRSLYREAFTQTFNVLKALEDVFDFYMYFRETLLCMVVKGILRVSDVQQYIPIVSKAESIIEDLDKQLSFSETSDDEIVLGDPIDKGSSDDLLQVFGEVNVDMPSVSKTYLDSNGRLTSSALIEVLTHGSDFLYRLRTSNNLQDLQCYQGFLTRILTGDYDPLVTFILDSQFKSKMLYKYTREEIVRAQHFCRSILSYYSPEVLVETAVHDYNQAVWGGNQLHVGVILESVEQNLDLLHSYGIISNATRDNLLTDIRSKLR